MTDWTDMEQGAVVNLLSGDTLLTAALQKFIKAKADDYRATCTRHMATVPRNPEAAADYAAKAQLLDEFWALLEDEAMRQQV